MTRHRRFQFGLLGLLGFVTIAAVILATTKNKFMLLVMLAPLSSFIASAGIVVLLAALIRDARQARLHASWLPLQSWVSWPVLLLIAMLGFLFFILWDIPSDLKRSFYRTAWTWLVYVGIFIGLVAGIWHITRPQFWKSGELMDR